jgi:hypothetical protein
MLSGRDPEADVMGTRAIAAADPDRFEPSSEQAHAAVDARQPRGPARASRP